jgi:hypothetical protein
MGELTCLQIIEASIKELGDNYTEYHLRDGPL